jgi:hypothetical protein
MRSVLCAVVVLVAIPAFADNSPPVRALDGTNVKWAFPRLGELQDRLIEIRTADELARSPAFADDAGREVVKRQVDFSREKAVVFAWWGRTPSSAHVKLAQDGKTVVFSVVTASPALADLRLHAAVFAVPRDVPVASGSLQDLKDLVKRVVTGGPDGTTGSAKVLPIGNP